jgi:hypothetical protein
MVKYHDSGRTNRGTIARKTTELTPPIRKANFIREMNQSSTSASEPASVSDRLTLLVFKDNFASRTFQIPLRWISQFGLLLGFLVLTSATSLFLAVKFYWIHLKADTAPTRELRQIQEMEQQMSDLKQQLKFAQANAQSNMKALALVQTQSQSQSYATPPKSEPVALNPVPAAVSTSTEAGNLLPSSVSGNIPNEASLPFAIEALKMSWRGHNLRVSFALQYRKDDQGTQQGRILIIGRGPDVILGYPDRVFEGPSNGPLISAENGESFSVSRYREVRAELGPVKPSHLFKTVEILIFNRENQLLVHRNLTVPPAPIPAAPVQTAPKPIPQESSEEKPNLPAAEGSKTQLPESKDPLPPTPEAATHES